MFETSATALCGTTGIIEGGWRVSSTKVIAIVSKARLSSRDSLPAFWRLDA